jgi:hypothetical protein
MKKLIAAALLGLSLAACGTSSTDGSSTTEVTEANTQECLSVPASFFRDIEAQGHVVKSGAVKSGVKSFALNRDIYEVAAKFSTGDVAVWSTERQIAGGGPTFPMNTAARKHSDQGVDAPASAIPDDPDGVAAAESCVQ